MTVHRALCISDIIIPIFQLVDEKSTLAQCARTSRFFSDPALDELWKQLESTRPLEALLPTIFTYDSSKYVRPLAI